MTNQLIQSKTKILFIAWDSPQVTYLESLFVPIFGRLQMDHNYEFHIIQFSWANSESVSKLKNYCASQGIIYFHATILLKPVSAIGKYWSAIKGSWLIRDYVEKHEINIVMPRSTMPAKIILSALKRNRKVKVIFDADGLPIEERIDFAGLRRGSIRHKQLAIIEKKIIARADAIMTRTAKAADYLTSQYNVSRSKLFIVTNGRDSEKFSPDKKKRQSVRNELGLPESSIVLVYCGSLGPQYGVEQMLYIFAQLSSQIQNVYFLVLTHNAKFLTDKIVNVSHQNVIVKQVPFDEIPSYLCASDFAFAIRKSSFSMQGVAPIKIGEYLLCGLPVIASSGIGDSDSILSNRDSIFLLKAYDEKYLDEAIKWIFRTLHTYSVVSSNARQFALDYFSTAQSSISYHKAIQSVL